MRDSQKSTNTLSVKVFWFPMIASVLIFGAVAFIVAGGGQEVQDLGSLTKVFPIAAVILGGLAIYLRGRVNFNHMPFGLIIWSLDESVAVVGLVAALLSNNAQAFVPYGVASLGLLILHRPR